jgi:hypothetical protein
MAHGKLIVALGMIAAASPLSANQPEQPVPAVAPAGGPDTRYCMRVEPVTGSRIETIECWTRQEWAQQGVDVDLEWAEEGVAVLT